MNTTSPAALKPCPFCGETHCSIRNAGNNGVLRQVYCRDVDCGARGPDRPSEDHAIAAWNNRHEFPSASLLLEHIPASHIGGTVKDAFDRLFAYLDYVRPDAPRNSTDPYQVGTSGSYSFEDLRRIADELKRQPLSVDEREALVSVARAANKIPNERITSELGLALSKVKGIL